MKEVIRVLPIIALLVLAGCGKYQFQTPIKPTPPPPVTQQQSFTVAPNQAKTIFVSANTGDRLTGSFTIQGGSGNDVNFSIKDPVGNVALNGGRVSNMWQFDFVCPSTGSYQIVFDNRFSIISKKTIDLTTTIYHSQ
jgi:hypothetical protein